MLSSILLLGCFTLLFNSITVAQYTWTRDAANPVVTGASTTIQHLADPCVIYDSGLFRMWTGCVESDPTFASVCYSESTDGTTWVSPVIVFSPSSDTAAWDNQKTEIPTVIKDTSESDPQKRYKMWYGGADSAGPDLTKIGYAYSPDGLTWTRVPAAQSPHGEDGLVMIPGFTIGDAGVVSDPTAIKIGGVYHLWYNSFGASNDVLISHATSTDGFNWDKDISNPVIIPTEPWEDFGPGGITADVAQPTVMIHPTSGDFFMSYGSFDSTVFERYDGFGYATSTDGTNWIKDAGNPFFLPDILKPGEEIGIHANSIVYVNCTYHMFYGGVNNLGIRNILHAISPDATLTLSISASICDGDSVLLAGIYQTTAGTYYDTLVSANGCDSIIATALTVNPLSTVNLGSDTTICNGCSITINAGAGFTSYLWSIGDTIQTISVDSAGTYTVQVTDVNGCTDTDTITITIATGINQSLISNHQSLIIYPNPTARIFTLEIILTHAEYVQIEVLNALGEIVFLEKLQPNTGIYCKQIDLSTYAKGSFFIQLKGVDGIFSKKLLLIE